MIRMVRLDQLNEAGLTTNQKMDAIGIGLQAIGYLLISANRTYIGNGLQASLDRDGMIVVAVPDNEEGDADDPHGAAR
jgi:hypothetical protein